MVAGLAIRFAAALARTRIMSGMLYGVRSTDLVSGVAIRCCSPARRRLLSGYPPT